MDNPSILSGISAQLTDVLDTLGEGIAFVDEEENFFFLNQIVANIFGYPKEEIIGKNFKNFLTEEEFGKVLQQSSNRREGKTDTYFLTITCKDGSLREIQSTVSPLFENGKFKGSCGVIRDLTESIKAKNQLEESENRFRTVSDVISDFAVSYKITEDNSFVPEWHSGLLPLRDTHGSGTILKFETWMASCHPDDLPVLLGAMEKIMKEREPVTFEYRVLTGDQSYEWLELYANPESEPNSGRIGRIIVAGKNITDRKNANLANQLTFSLVNKLNLAASIPEIFSAVRSELQPHLDCSNLYLGLISKVDFRMTTYFQSESQVCSEQKSYEDSLNALVMENRKPVFLKHQEMAGMISQGAIPRLGSPSLGWAGVPLIIGEEIIGVLSVSSSEKENFLSPGQLELLVQLAPHIAVTLRRHQDEEALKTSEANLRESNMSKDKFFSIISHDLRGPFNAIIGFSDLLHNDFETLEVVEQRLMIKNIYDASIGTFKLLENLLEWSRIQTGRTKPNPENIDLSTVANTSLGFLKPQAEKKNIKLFSGIHFGTIAYCDENMITTVIRNLISNAIKFTQPGGNVRIWSGIRENYVEVTVSDNGIGIPKESISKLFRLDESVKTRGTAGEQGTGLGLLLCREFIELNNGKIDVESEPGKGSQFKFTLPKQ